MTSLEIAAILGAILDLLKIGIVKKRLIFEIFYTGHVEDDAIKHFAAFCQHFVHFSPKEG